MFSDKQQTFSDLLIGWYKQNGRELPWRMTKPFTTALPGI